MNLLKDKVYFDRKYQQLDPNQEDSLKVQKEPRLNLKTLNKTLSLSVEDCKRLGNDHFHKKEYSEALKLYSEGLKQSPKHIDLLSNRSATYLNLEDFRESLKDAEDVLEIDKTHLKAIYRKTKSLLGLRKYPQAVQFLNGILPRDKIVPFDLSAILKLKTKLEDQLSGLYNMQYFLDAKRDGIKIEDCAEYVDESLQLMNIPGKDRGLIATSHIKAGQLLIVSKALVYYDPNNDENNNNNECFDINIETKTFRSRSIQRLIENIINLLIKKPELSKELYSLYAGPQFGYLKDDRVSDFIDTKRIEGICNFNPFSPKETFELNLMRNNSIGLWFYPSFINHSCVDCNASWDCFNDFLFVRAFKDIREGEEICITYISPTDNYRKRKDVLNVGFGFKCDCRLCTIEENETELIREKCRQIREDLEKEEKKKIVNGKRLKKLHKYELELEKIRPNLNFLLKLVREKLSNHYFCSSNFQSAALIMEKMFFESMETSLPSVSLSIAVNLAAAYGELNDYENTIKWIEIWKERLNVNYGSKNVNLFKNTKTRLALLGYSF